MHEEDGKRLVLQIIGDDVHLSALSECLFPERHPNERESYFDEVRSGTSGSDVERLDLRSNVNAYCLAVRMCCKPESKIEMRDAESLIEGSLERRKDVRDDTNASIGQATEDRAERSTTQGVRESNSGHGDP